MKFSVRNLALLATILSVCVSAFSPASNAEETKVFKAGAATSNVTPWLGVSLAGHMNDRVARHVHDELHARCVVLDDGATILAFAVVDSCMIPREVVDAAKRQIQEATGIPVGNILIAATHTHTAPTAAPCFQSDPDPAYQRFLARRIADGISRAVNNFEPARIAWGSAELPEEVFNRRWRMKPGAKLENPFGGEDQVKMNPPRASEDLLEPAGPTDPEIAFFSVQSVDARPIALLANYSLHYVGGTRAGEISADYFGIFADRIQQLLGADRLDPPFVGIMTNGSSGDINNINFRESAEPREPYEQMTHVAYRVAEKVYRAYGGLAYHDWAPLASAREEIELGVRKPTVEEVARAREIIANAQGPDMKSLTEIYARETVLINDYPDVVPVILQVFRIGDLGIASVPCEVFVEIGLDIKARSPFPQTFTIELANGYNGYLPTAEHHALGGYETWRARSSYLEIEAANKITQTILTLMDRLASPGPPPEAAL